MTRVWLVVVVGLLLAGGSLGCKPRELAFHRVELPGFSVEAPTYVEAPAGATYRRGSLEHKSFPTVITISWQPGEILTVDEMPAAVQVIVDQVAPGGDAKLGTTRAVKIGGQDAMQLDASIERVKLTFVDITCGARSVMITIAGLGDYAAIRDRMLRTFTCAPSAADEKALASAFPIGAADPAVFDGWRFADEDRAVMTITNGELSIVFTEAPKSDSVDIDQMRKLLPKLFGVGGGTFTPAGDATREVRVVEGGERRVFDRGTMTADGETMLAVTSIWICDDRERLVIALALMLEEGSRAGAIDFISKVRCSQPDDAPLPIGPYVPDDEPPADGAPDDDAATADDVPPG